MAGKGSLVLVVGFSLIMGYITMNLTDMGRAATEGVVWYNSSIASKNLVNIGAHTGLAMLRTDPDWIGPLTQSVVEGPYRGGKFTVRVIETSPGIYMLRSVSEFPQVSFPTVRDTVDIHLRGVGENDTRMFAWFANVNGNAQFYYGDDVVWGPVHSNGGIHLGNIPHGQTVPVFHGMVTASQNITPTGGNRAKFLGGFATGQDKIDMPKEFNDLIAASLASDGLYYDTDIQVEIAGEEVIISSLSGGTDMAASVSDIYNLSDFNGAIYSTENISVWGKLNGKLTIGAGRDLKIVGDVKYAADPPYETIELGMVDGEMRETHDRIGSDILGLFAANNIVIKDIPGKHNYTVHGVLFALNEVVAENYKSRPLGTFNLWGSLIMHDRGQIRWQNNGLIQRLKYDNGFDDPTFRPLYFPGWEMNSFEILAWWESIQKPPF